MMFQRFTKVTQSFITLMLLGRIALAAPEQTLNWGNAGEPRDLDVHIITGVPEFHIVLNLHEALVSKHPKTLEPIPGVAESWQISKDGKTYTFKLRKNAKWSNGEPVTAKDFVYSWTRLLEPKTASEYAAQGFYFKNGKAYNEGKLKDASQLGFKATDDYTLVVTLENPTPFFLGLLYHHSLYPVHRATIEKFGQKWTRPENFVGNGAFVLKKWDMNKVITLEKSPTYWDAASVKLEKVNFYPIDKQDTEEKMFRSGQLHVTDEVPVAKVDYWKKDKTGVYHSHPWLGTYFYWFNMTKKPLDNKLVRKAIALGIDREKIVNLVMKGGQLPGQMLTPPGTGGFQPKAIMPKDLSRLKEAKELLSKAGYPGGKGLPPLEILYNTSENHKKVAEAIQQMLKENLGLEVTLFNQEWKVYLESLEKKNYTLGRQGWIADYNDPNTFLDLLMSNNPNNKAGYVNKEYDALLAAASTEKNSKKRLEIFQKAENMLMEDLPILPIYIYSRNYLRSNSIVGWDDNIEDIHPLKYVSIK